MFLGLKNVYPVLGTPSGGELTVFLTGFSYYIFSRECALCIKLSEINLYPFSSVVRYALCPMPYALCPMPYALCPMPYALCPMHVGYLMLLRKAIAFLG